MTMNIQTISPSISVDVDEDYSPKTLSPSSYSDALSFTLLSLIPELVDLPFIRVPPPLTLSEIPLRERRGFEEFITITPRPDVIGKKSAKGQIQPTAGSLPRRRRKSSSMRRAVVKIVESEDSDESSDSEDDD
ncbi:hypothetical protein LENED_000723 [Lentinula edodes]|uniref:Uncharacterized protein n=1 Tax=Lentinula edodes TaxID=5353 RepID=A0A1Q3DWH4_LENED|nr:hypothetical protein LENED_000723 [Lentinula edodes]